MNYWINALRIGQSSADPVLVDIFTKTSSIRCSIQTTSFPLCWKKVTYVVCKVGLTISNYYIHSSIRQLITGTTLSAKKVMFSVCFVSRITEKIPAWWVLWYLVEGCSTAQGRTHLNLVWFQITKQIHKSFFSFVNIAIGHSPGRRLHSLIALLVFRDALHNLTYTILLFL